MPVRKEKKVLWLVTARSGTKGIPDKNIKRLGRWPLMAYRIRQALAFASKSDVWVSTDSIRYAKLAVSFGARVPFLRPGFLATDCSTSVDATLHAMRWAEEKGMAYDAIGVLEPTAPFVKSSYLVDAVKKLFSDTRAMSIVATRPVRPSTYYVQKDQRYLSKLARRLAKKGILRRQEEKGEITPSGGFYIAKWGYFMKSKTFYSSRTLSYRLPEVHGLEIDEPIDWCWAEFLLAKHLVKPQELLKVSLQ